MNVKLDENLPVSAASILTAAGHDVDTVEDERLTGEDDATVSRAATAVGRLILTLDRGFGDVQRYPPGTDAGIVVLRLDDQSAVSIRRTLVGFVTDVDLESLRGCVAVFRDGILRVRRPADH